MRQKTSLIILRVTRYSDRHDIVLAYGRTEGPVSFLASATRGKGAARMRALLMPMSVVSGELSLRAGRSIGTLGDASAMVSLHGVMANPVKCTVAMFMADLLAAVVREGMADATLWDFAAGSAQTLDALLPARLANFPVVFVMSLATMLGIAPDGGSYSRGRLLDLRDGIYRATTPMHTDFATPAESRIVAAAARLNYGNMHRLRLPREARSQLLDGMLRYITMHHARVDSLKSLTVLRSLF